MSRHLENKQIKNIYLFHFFNNVAISVVANFLFLDQLFLRMGLAMTHIGLIKGVGYLIPMTVNLLAAPIVQRWDRDRELVAVAYLFRVTLPLLLLVFPQMNLKQNSLALVTGALLVIIQIFPIMANNSIQVLIRSSIRTHALGRHLAGIQLIWTLPGFLVVIPLSLYMDSFALRSDGEFYRAMFYCMAGTGIFQAAASIIMLRYPKPRLSGEKLREEGSWISHVTSPFRDRNFMKLLWVIVLSSLFTSMVRDFINPYFLSVRHLNMGFISLVSAAVSVLSIGILPLWGFVIDTIGGRNSYRIALSGLAMGIATLMGDAPVFILVFALLAWDGHRGIFGGGLYSIQQYFTMINSPKGYQNTYFAAATFASGFGMFAGSSLGGIIIDGISLVVPSLDRAASFRVSFLVAIAGLISVIILAQRLPHDRDHITGKDMWLYVFRLMRSLFGRFR